MRLTAAVLALLAAMMMLAPVQAGISPSGRVDATGPSRTPASLAGWVQQNSGVNAQLSAIAIHNDTSALVVCAPTGGPSPVVLHTNNSGTNWSRVTNNGTTMLNTAQMIDADTWVVAGAAGVFGRTDNWGRTWTWKTVGNPNDFFLDVQFNDPMNGWIVGVLEGGVGARTPMARTPDGGATWIKIFPSQTYALRGIEFLSSSVAVTAGSNGTAPLVMRSTDGGMTWSVIPFPAQGSPTPLLALTFPDPAVGYTASTAGRFWRSDDGGLTWNGSLVDTSGGTGDIGALHFINVDHGWAATSTGRIYVTRDGGVSWTRQTVPNSPNSFADIRFFNDTIGYAVGINGDIHFTAD